MSFRTQPLSESCSVEYDSELQTANDNLRRSSVLLNDSALDVEKRAKLAAIVGSGVEEKVCGRGKGGGG